MSPPLDHATFHRRIPAYLSGLLEEAGASAMSEHAGGCAECRASLDEARSAEATRETDGRHVPASLLARWSRARTELRGLERAMVSRHLEHCDECRQALELLGHEPVLESAPLVVPAGESALAKALDTAGSAVSREADRVVRVVVEKARSGRDWFRITLGGWALAASAAAVLLLARPPGTVPLATGPGPGTVTPTPVTPPVGATSATPKPPPTMVGTGSGESTALALAQIVRYESSVRGGGEEPEATKIEPGTRLLALEIPLEDLPDAPRASKVDIEVRDPAGGKLLGRRSTMAELLANRLLLVSVDPSAVKAGAYRVTLRFAAGDSIERRFHLSRPTH